MQNAQVFALGQNHPNPVVLRTTIPVQIKTAGEMTWSLWGMDGRRVHVGDCGRTEVGRHEVVVDFGQLSIPASSYLYQVDIKTPRGRFTDVKRMTVVK
jgi:hypothetical protein